MHRHLGFILRCTRGKKMETRELKKGIRLKTFLNAEIVVDKHIADGGGCSIYTVDYPFENGTEKLILKWFRKNAFGSYSADFYENAKQNVRIGSPSKEFLWLIDVTDWIDDTFGTITEVIPDEYYPLTDFLMTKQKFSSFKIVVDSALYFINAMRLLHIHGLSYKGMDDGSLYINPMNGNILLSQTDYITPDGIDCGMMSNPRYTAPEVVTNKSVPNALSDRYTMAIMIYMLFCLNHPMEGKRYLVPCLTYSKQEELYGSNPLFMMDPNDDSNGPHPILHRNSIAVWNAFPKYVRDIFLKAFGEKALKNPSARPNEYEWLRVFTRFRSDIVSCECGNEVFAFQGQPCRCEECGNIINIPYSIDLQEYQIPVIKGSRIYKCQVGFHDVNESLKPVGIVLKKSDSNEFGLRNLSDLPWKVVSKNGVSHVAAPKEVLLIKDGIVITIFDKRITINKNESFSESNSTAVSDAIDSVKISDYADETMNLSKLYQENPQAKYSDPSLKTMMAYSEVLAILNLLEASYASRVPHKVKAFFEEECLKDYEPQIDVDKPLTEQNLQRETMVLLAMLNVNYWCNSVEEREFWLREMAKNDNKEYDPNDTSWDLGHIFGFQEDMD